MMHGPGEHVLRTEELRDVRRGRLAEDPLGRPGLQDASAVEQDRDVAEQSRFGEVVRHLKDGDVPLLVKRANLATHANAAAWIEGAERLVEQQDRRPGRESASDGDELTLASGQAADG